MISAAGRGGPGSLLAGAAATDRARGSVPADLSLVTAGLAGTRLLFTSGAGCGPDCKNNTLTRIMMVAPRPTMQPTASRELQPHAGNAKMRGIRRSMTSSLSRLSSERPARRRLVRSALGTEFHPFV